MGTGKGECCVVMGSGGILRLSWGPCGGGVGKAVTRAGDGGARRMCCSSMGTMHPGRRVRLPYSH